MRARVEALCQSLGVVATGAQVAAAAGFLDLLVRWNGVYNLTSVREVDAMFTQHLADCLAIVPSLTARAAMGRVLDVGSGGGLPGVVIAIFVPQAEVCCVDAVGKKSAFIRQVAGALGLGNLSAVHGRVESLREPAFDTITSRAFASLEKFVQVTANAVRPGGNWVAMKGRVPQDELQALPARIEVFHVEQLIVPGLDAQRCLVWMREKSAPTATPVSPVA